MDIPDDHTLLVYILKQAARKEKKKDEHVDSSRGLKGHIFPHSNKEDKQVISKSFNIKEEEL